MAFLSNGVLTKDPTYTTFTPASWNGWPQPGITQAWRWGSYSSLYQRQLWVAVLVNKIGNATARLPLKVYRRGEDGRSEARDTPYAALLAQPNRELDPFLFWLWVSSTLNVYGEAFLLKVRDQGGRPIELVPCHPTSVVDDDQDGPRKWFVQHRDGSRTPVARRDFVHFRHYNPDSTVRGLSPLEPLRDTLENEQGARRANSALWRNGGRPSVFLTHPKQLTKEAGDRLRDRWDSVHGGVDNWAKAALLEEGMEAKTLALNAEELQYVDSRKLNREECCAAYDVPPPVVHILDRATFSNITEQMRSMYRDTMGPKLGLLESTLEFELRDGRFGRSGEPDFGGDVYSEFLMDEVLRGDFEVRAEAYRNADWMTLAEKRRKENLPFIPGTDRLFLNSAQLPLNADGNLEQPAAIPTEQLRSVMGRLSRQTDLAEVDPKQLTAGLNGHSDLVLRELDAAQIAGLSVPQFRDRLRALEAR